MRLHNTSQLYQKWGGGVQTGFYNKDWVCLLCSMSYIFNVKLRLILVANALTSMLVFKESLSERSHEFPQNSFCSDLCECDIDW
jgi:hypothetical protein